jgi:hypothetical protein
VVVEEDQDQAQFVVQHRGQGATLRSALTSDEGGELRREPPRLTCRVFVQDHGGFHSLALEWQRDDGRTQVVACAQRPGSAPNPRPSTGWRPSIRSSTDRFASPLLPGILSVADASASTLAAMRLACPSERPRPAEPARRCPCSQRSAESSHCCPDRCRGGWIGFDRFMALALYTPGIGYYGGGAHKFGAERRFRDRPGTLRQLRPDAAGQVQQLLALSAPQIIEVGAGSGQLASDLLLELELRGGPPRALRDPRTVGRIAGAAAADHQPPESSPAATRALA